jgi:hypothetical protein
MPAMRRVVLLYLGFALSLGCNSKSQAPPGPGPVADAAIDVRAASDAKTTVDVAAEPDGLAADAVAGAVPDVGGGTHDTAPAAAWPEVTDYSARGPFAITRDMNIGPGGGYDVFRPMTLDRARPHPVISWANGTLFDIPDYQKLLEHWASHGFVVIAGHINSTAGGGTHKAGIDWLLAEHARAGSPYQGALDGKHIGAAGHSQGGGATIAAGANKPGTTGIVATLPLMPLLSFESDATVVNRQLAPMLNINATSDNRDPSGMVPNRIFQGATKDLVQAAFVGVHEDAMNVAMFRPALAWFRLHLMGDERARGLFYPAGTCGLCLDPAWRLVRYKP